MTSSASLIPPSPPFAHTSDSATFTPSSLHLDSTKSSSAFVSVGNALIATTHGSLYTFLILKRASEGSEYPSQVLPDSHCSDLPSNAAIVLQRTNGRYDDNCARLQSRHTALDVEEFLRTEVCTEACLCDRIIAKFQSHLRCDNGVTSMCDICERSVCTIAGTCSSVCTRFGFQASFRSAHIAPSA